MNIGITTIYAHRQIVFFAAYLAKLLKENGDNVSSLVCDSSLPTCYSILSKGKNKLTECPMCILGGLRSFNIDSYYSINKNAKAEINSHELDEIAFSSIMTLERAENKEDISSSVNTSKKFVQLKETVAITYQNAIDWIKKDNLDLVICYNGRMDATKAILKACESMGVNYLSLERSLYGYGIQLIPNNNCLSLIDRIRINNQFKDTPLTNEESGIADWLAEKRISQKSHLEWRTYSSESKSADNFIFPKVLILPSSNCEFIGNSEWDTTWGHFTNALDELLTKSSLKADDIAIKMHPVWDQYIGQKNGVHITTLYSNWANKNKIRIIDAENKVSSTDLIREANYIIVGGSSAGIDAALLGKKVILLGHAHYEGAGFVCHIKNDYDWGKLKEIDQMNPDYITIRAKRYLYASTFRFNQLTNKAIPLDLFRYIFKRDNLDFIYLMHNNNILEPWNINLSDYNIKDEIDKKGMPLFDNESIGKTIIIKRRLLFRFIDSARKLFPRGDQIREAKK